MTGLTLLISLPLILIIGALMTQFSLICQRAREEEFLARSRRVSKANSGKSAPKPTSYS